MSNDPFPPPWIREVFSALERHDVFNGKYRQERADGQVHHTITFTIPDRSHYPHGSSRRIEDGCRCDQCVDAMFVEEKRHQEHRHTQRGRHHGQR